MPPRTKNPKMSKRKQDQPSSSLNSQGCFNEQIERWMKKAPHSIKRYEDIQKKILHIGPFCNFLEFSMYDLDELVKMPGWKP